MYKAYQNAGAGKSPALTPYLQSPLHAFDLPAQARPQDDGCGVWMNEVPLLGYIVVRGDLSEPGLNDAVQSVLGVALPAKPSTVVTAAQALVIWQSPDEWLVVCPRARIAELVHALEAATATIHAQIVDNSGGLTQIRLSGRHQVDLLRHVGVYDFTTITPGRAVSTVCQKASMVVYRVDGNDLFVIFRRSFADYVWRLLRLAAQPYGLGICTIEHDADHPVFSLT